MSIFGATKNEELSVIFDIASGTLAAGLVHFVKGKPPEMLYSYREPIISKREIDSDSLTVAMLKTLENVASVLVRDGLSHIKMKGYKDNVIDKVYYVFSSPWVIAESKVLKNRYERDVEITKDLINYIIAEEEKSFEKLYSEHRSKDKLEYDIKIIEKSVSEVSLNGYVTPAPYGKRAHEVEVPFFMTVTSTKLLDRINRAVTKVLHPRVSVTHSCNLLSYSTLRDIHHNVADFIFVDVHGELTDISVVRRGMLIYASSFPIGVNTLVRKVAKDLKTLPQIAESHIKIFLEGKSDKETSVLMKKTMNLVKDEWIASFHKAVDQINETLIMPDSMFLVVGAGMENYFANFIKEEKFETLSMVNSGFNITVLSDVILSEFCTFFKKNERDSFLAMHSIALDRLESVNK